MSASGSTSPSTTRAPRRARARSRSRATRGASRRKPRTKGRDVNSSCQPHAPRQRVRRLGSAAEPGGRGVCRPRPEGRPRSERAQEVKVASPRGSTGCAADVGRGQHVVWARRRDGERRRGTLLVTLDPELGVGPGRVEWAGDSELVERALPARERGDDQRPALRTCRERRSPARRPGSERAPSRRRSGSRPAALRPRRQPGWRLAPRASSSASAPKLESDQLGSQRAASASVSGSTAIRSICVPLAVALAAANDPRHLRDREREALGRLLVAVDRAVHVAPHEKRRLGDHGALERVHDGLGIDEDSRARARTPPRGGRRGAPLRRGGGRRGTGRPAACCNASAREEQVPRVAPRARRARPRRVGKRRTYALGRSTPPASSTRAWPPVSRWKQNAAATSRPTSRERSGAGRAIPCPFREAQEDEPGDEPEDEQR